MESNLTRLKCCLYINNKIHLVNLFGHANRGVPGIDMIGMGRWGKIIREKIIYFTRQEEVNSTLRKYTLCIEEGHLFTGKNEEFSKNLELPLLLLYWSLSKRIPIQHLEDCLAVGSVSISGEINIPKFNKEEWELIKGLIRKNELADLKFLSTGRGEDPFSNLDLSMLLRDKKQVYLGGN